MRTSLYVTTLLTGALLQSRGGQAIRSESVMPNRNPQLSGQAVKDTEINRASQSTSRKHRTGDEKLTTHETQIIRELHQAGCLIEDFEMDRRKQNMRISCAKDIAPDNSSI